MNFAALKAAWDEDHDMTQLVPVARGAIPRRELKLTLLGLGKLEAVKTAVPTFFSDADFDTINPADPLTQVVLGQLQAASILTATDVAALTALGTAHVPRWQALGFSEAPHAGDLAHAATL